MTGMQMQDTIPRTPIVNAMTVDVEDYYQVSAFEGVIPRADWPKWPSRVERNTERFLALFAARDIKATFFTLGCIAERHPALIRRIVAEGHELASHGYAHVRVIHQQPEAFRADILRTKALLEDLSGQSVRGYRAASYSIGAQNLWALDLLAEAGYQYSSSIYPVRHDLYGMPDAPRFPFRHGALLEVPISTVRLFERNLPAGGGGFFRLFPYRVSRWAIRRVNEAEGRACVFYCHPWELDHEQPRPPRLPLRTRFRHYLNLGRMESRLGRLLGDFRWGRMDEVFLDGGAR
jgi:polysaccharide deacetylase family protein (PEP-CTERM system associated)